MTNKMTAKTVFQYEIYTFILAWIPWIALIITNQFGYLEFSREAVIPMIFYALPGFAPIVVTFVVLSKNKIMTDNNRGHRGLLSPHNSTLPRPHRHRSAQGIWKSLSG